MLNITEAGGPMEYATPASREGQEGAPVFCCLTHLELLLHHPNQLKCSVIA